jgi:microsomal dipeptidase-like Zn-dependent dipeptidase
VGLRAVCNNPGNISDDVLKMLAAKDGMIGIHSSAELIGQKYYDLVVNASTGSGQRHYAK